MWFLLYLCVISTVALPIIRLGQAPCHKVRMENWPLWAIISLSIPLWAVWQLTPSHPQSLAGCFVLFLLGALFFASDALQDKLAQWRWSLFIPFSMLSLVWINVDKNLLSSWWGDAFAGTDHVDRRTVVHGVGQALSQLLRPRHGLSFRLVLRAVHLPPVLVGGNRLLRHPDNRTRLGASARHFFRSSLAATLATYELCRRIALDALYVRRQR